MRWIRIKIDEAVDRARRDGTMLLMPWRTTPAANAAVDFNTRRPVLKRSTFFDACAFPLDRLVGDGRLRSPLHLAAEAGLVELVASAVGGRRGPPGRGSEPTGAPTFEINGKDCDGWTPLMHACFRGGVLAEAWRGR